MRPFFFFLQLAKKKVESKRIFSGPVHIACLYHLSIVCFMLNEYLIICKMVSPERMRMLVTGMFGQFREYRERHSAVKRTRPHQWNVWRGIERNRKTKLIFCDDWWRTHTLCYSSIHRNTFYGRFNRNIYWQNEIQIRSATQWVHEYDRACNQRSCIYYDAFYTRLTLCQSSEWTAYNWTHCCQRYSSMRNGIVNNKKLIHILFRFLRFEFGIRMRSHGGRVLKECIARCWLLTVHFFQ